MGGDLDLLNAERNIHQLYRWSKGDSLGFDGIYGVGTPYLTILLDSWVCGPSNFLNVAHLLSLLGHTILDAWLGCYPDVPEQDNDEFLVVNLTRYPSYFLVDRMHPLLERRDELVLEDLYDFPVLSLRDGAFPKIQPHLKRLGFQRSNVGITRHIVSSWEGQTEDQVTVSYGTERTIGNFGGTKVPLPLSTGLTVGDALVIKRRFACSEYFRQLLLCLGERSQFLSESFDDLECCSDPFDWLSNSSSA